MLRDRLAGVPDLEVDVQLVSADESSQSAFIIDVSWRGCLGLMCEVADWVDGVRILDPHGEDVTVDVGLRYVEARASDLSPRRAWKFAREAS